MGTGGRSLNKFGTTRANSQVRLNNAYGVIKLTLHSNSYNWEFETVPNGTADSGSGSCHVGSSSTDTTPPTVLNNTVPATGATGVPHDRRHGNLLRGHGR